MLRRLLATRAARAALATASASIAAFGLGAPAPALAAESCPNAAVRAQQGTERLPECRAYEMVSSAKKSGQQAGVGSYANASYTRTSADGNRVKYYVTGSVGTPYRGMQFYANTERTATGWTDAVAAIPGPEAGITASFFNHGPIYETFSDDTTRIAWSSQQSYVTDNPSDPSTPAGSNGGAYLTTSEGPIQWLTRPQIAAPEPEPGDMLGLDASGGMNGLYFPVGGAPDFDPLYFNYCGTLTSADAPRAGKRNYGFFVSENGQVSSAATLPDGSIDPDGAIDASAKSLFLAAACTSYSPPNGGIAKANSVSTDGSRALFLSPDPSAQSGRPSQLYLHRHGASSILISKSEVTGDAAPTGAILDGTFATPDTSHVIFRSSDKLTSDAPAPSTVGHYYRWTRATGELDYIDLPEPENLSTAAAIYAISDDASRILFQTRVGTTSGLALWDHGEVTSVGTFPGTDNGGASLARFSTDGSNIVFSAKAPFVGGVTTQAPSASEIYRYVIGQAGPPTCISCVATGMASGSAILSMWREPGWGSTPFSSSPFIDGRNVSPDGRRVFFQSAEALVPQDTNGKTDVYLWHDGELSLISTGQSGEDSFLFDTSASGDDVIFATSEGIDPSDTDGVYDVYDARVDGGFLRKDVAACSGDSCQPPPSAPWTALEAASVTFAGPGNVAGENVKPGAGTVSVAKVKAVVGTTATVTVKVPAAGSIALRGASVRKSTRTASKPATYRVKVSLTAQAKAKLAKAKVLKAKVTVGFQPKSGPRLSKAVTLTFKQPASKPGSKRGRS